MISFMIALASVFAFSGRLSGMEHKMQQLVDDQDIQISVLKYHFLSFYQAVAENQATSEAFFKENGETQQCCSAIDNCYFNMVMGYPAQENQWDQYIEEQLKIFKTAQVPFVWYVDEEASSRFKEKLIQHGFKDGGVFRGVAGWLDPSISLAQVPADSTLERVEDAAAMDEWADLVCVTFGMENIKDSYKKTMWELALQSKAYHWLARKQGKAVSAVSTVIEGNIVSFWNGASLPELRRQGYSTALRRLALQHAVDRGCQIGASYLMSEGLAYGICRKLGYGTRWRFNVFLWDQK